MTIQRTQLGGVATVVAMSSEIVAYVAVSLDGYIAEADGSVEFLERFGSDEYGFHDFVSGIDAVVMGSATYEQILGFGWPYGDTPGLVLTTRELPTPEEATISFSEAATGSAIRDYAMAFEKRIWVVGGGRVITEALLAGAVDTLEMYVMPIALGSGVPLFAQPYTGRLELREALSFTNGVVKLEYLTAP
jgi:dihydrofolate reductase